MGQYHIVANLDKKEWLNPHDLGDGLKLYEFGGSSCGTMTALAMLLAVSNGRGGGDFPEHKLVGRWGGDRIVIVGDYAEMDDIPGVNNAKEIYDHKGWKNISGQVRKHIEKAYEIRFVGEGWLERITEEEYKLRRLAGEKSLAS